MAMSNAERVARHRARKRGEDVPPKSPGPPPGHGGRPRQYRQWRILADTMRYVSIGSIDEIMDNPEDKNERLALEVTLLTLAADCKRLAENELSK